jgi:hypothetical protein
VNWFSIQITLWPILLGVFIWLFRKQIEEMIKSISYIRFGNFAFRLRRRMKLSDEMFLKIKNLNSIDLQFFFIVASQSWKIEKVNWKINIDENIERHKKLENIGLIKISNLDSAKKDNNVNAALTAIGEEFYNELSSLISESIN